MKFIFEPDDLEILQGIVEESSEHLNGIEEGILKLEAEFNIGDLDSVFRAMHSVKGVAGFVDFVPIKDTAHVLESFLTDMKKGVYQTSSDITDILLRGVDILNMLVGQLGVRLKDLEANPPREEFELLIDDFGFKEFVQEAEQMRDVIIQGAPDDIANAESLLCSNGADNNMDLPEPVANVMKIELSSFLEQVLQDFMEETSEHLDTIEKNCVELERHPGQAELLNAILRGFHSIKGGAGVITSMQEETADDSFQKIKTLTHAAETLLQNYRNRNLPLSSQVIDLILAAVDVTSALSGLSEDKQNNALSIDELVQRMEALTDTEKDAMIPAVRKSDEKIPRQLLAFANITNQALESMESIINSAQENAPVNKKRLKQYIRALNSIASSCRYLDYDDVVEFIESHEKYMENLLPDKDVVSFEVVQNIKLCHEKIKQMLEQKISSVKEMLANVPLEYGEKKLGEILVAEKKITQEDLEQALAQQKKIGEILIDSGKIKPRDVEIALLEQEAAREKGQEVVQQTRTAADTGGQSIRVSQEKMNRLMNMIGELLISKNRVFHLSSKIGIEYELPTLAREVKDIAAEVARIADELQDAIMSARMVPLRILFQRYPRTIRDISRKAGKIVDLIIDGEETELDKTVIEAINDPLVHMLRNAVDHGIESPEIREALGKNTRGTINLKARYQGNHVVIEISDDGKGLNPEEIKAKALKKGLIRPDQIETLSREEAYQLLFLPGFSTRDEVSELSGRGVGMDVVKNNIEQVGGSISMSSQVNAGSTFLLKIPLSMSIIKGLMLKSGDQSFIIPLDTIEETVKLSSASIRRYKNILVADIRQEIVHLIRLDNILGISSQEQSGADTRISVVVINVDGNRFGLIVDSFQHEQEFVVKALAEELASIKIYTGATILGDGNVVLILNPAQLFQSFLQAESGG